MYALFAQGQVRQVSSRQEFIRKIQLMKDRLDGSFEKCEVLEDEKAALVCPLFHPFLGLRCVHLMFTSLMCFSAACVTPQKMDHIIILDSQLATAKEQHSRAATVNSELVCVEIHSLHPFTFTLTVSLSF
jgi:hypothetical protein